MKVKEHQNDHQIVDYSAILAAKYGEIGTPERIVAEEKAIAFFTGKIIEDARKEANMTQLELAKKVGSNKSYISRIETGRTEPKVSTFYRIASALGRSVELNPV
jgi:DNA-binding XRE family transcriptional regulator